VGVLRELCRWEVDPFVDLSLSCKLFSTSIYCKSTIYFRRHNNIMVYLLNFSITYIIILATCFDPYENCCTYCFTVFVLRQKL